MLRKQSLCLVARVFLASLCVAGSVGIVTAQPAPPRLDRLQSSGTAQQAAQPISVTAGMPLADLLLKPDNTVLLLPDGTRSTVGALRNAVRTRDEAMTALKNSSAAPTTGVGKRVVTRASHPDEEARAVLADPRWGRAMDSGIQAKSADAALAEGVHYIVTTQGNRNVSPGDTLTIVGRGFGDKLGEAALVGRFPGGAVKLQVLNWRDTEIKTKLPGDIRGVPDHDVELQVVTAGRRTMPSGKGGYFVATREQATLDRGLGRVLRTMQQGAPVVPMSDDGIVSRWVTGSGSLSCWSPGRDLYDIVDPGRGWVVTGYWYWVGRSDAGGGDATGRPGSRTFTGAYDVSIHQYEKGKRAMVVDYGVWSSVSSAHSGELDVLLSRDTSARGCGSWYKLNVILSGPAGTSPF